MRNETDPTLKMQFLVLAAAIACAVAVILPGIAAASGAGAAQAAGLRSGNPRQECREERQEHPSKFRGRYGTGEKAMQRCIRHERNDND